MTFWTWFPKMDIFRIVDLYQLVHVPREWEVGFYGIKVVSPCFRVTQGLRRTLKRTPSVPTIHCKRRCLTLPNPFLPLDLKSG